MPKFYGGYIDAAITQGGTIHCCQIVGRVADAKREDVDRVIGKKIEELPVAAEDIPYIKEVIRQTLASGEDVKIVVSISGTRRIGIAMHANPNTAIVRIFVPKG